MPSKSLETLVKDAPGKSLDDAERYWNEAKKSAKEQGLKEGTDDFYAYVMAIVMRRLGLKEYSSEVVLSASSIRLSPKDRANLRKLAKSTTRIMPYSNPIRALMFVHALIDDLVLESLEWAVDYIDDSELEMDKLHEVNVEASSIIHGLMKRIDRLSNSVGNEVDALNTLRLRLLKEALRRV